MELLEKNSRTSGRLDRLFCGQLTVIYACPQGCQCPVLKLHIGCLFFKISLTVAFDALFLLKMLTASHDSLTPDVSAQNERDLESIPEIVPSNSPKSTKPNTNNSLNPETDSDVERRSIPCTIPDRPLHGDGRNNANNTEDTNVDGCLIG